MSEEERPSIEELIERPSLGTPYAKRMRARTSPEVARQIVERANAKGRKPTTPPYEKYNPGEGD